MVGKNANALYLRNTDYILDTKKFCIQKKLVSTSFYTLTKVQNITEWNVTLQLWYKLALLRYMLDYLTLSNVERVFARFFIL